MTYEFNSKETYFAARAAWKHDYFELSNEIRAAKQNYKKAQRAFSATPAIDRESSIEARGKYYAAAGEVAATLSARIDLRRKAKEHLDILAKLKVEAARQWQEEHAVPQN